MYVVERKAHIYVKDATEAETKAKRCHPYFQTSYKAHVSGKNVFI